MAEAQHLVAYKAPIIHCCFVTYRPPYGSRAVRALYQVSTKGIVWTHLISRSILLWPRLCRAYLPFLLANIGHNMLAWITLDYTACVFCTLHLPKMSLRVDLQHSCTRSICRNGKRTNLLLCTTAHHPALGGFRLDTELDVLLIAHVERCWRRQRQHNVIHRNVRQRWWVYQ